MVADAARVAAAERLQKVGALPGLDRLAELAARLLGAAGAQVSLLSDTELIAAGAGSQAGAVRAEGRLEDTLCSLTVASGSALVLADTRADARVAALPPVASGAVGAYLGAPLTARSGQVVGALCVVDAAARTWSEADVVLLQQVADSAAAELELAALDAEYQTSRSLLEVSVRAAGVGTYTLDLATEQLTWNEQMYALFGVDPAGFADDLSAAYERIHPDDRAGIQNAIDTAIATGEDFTSSYRVLLPGGGIRWIAARGTVARDSEGNAVRLLGAAYDVTALREAGARMEQILDAMAVGYLALDAEWRMTYANAQAEQIIGRPREQLLGRNLWEEFPAALGSVFEEHYRGAVATGGARVFDAYYPAPLDVWVEVRAQPEQGGLGLYFLDISARKAAQQAAEAAADRLALLAAVSAELSETFDAQQAVARLAQLVVPALADWCVVTLVEDEASITTPATARASRAVDLRRALRDVGSWHRDEALRPLVGAYAAHRVAALQEGSLPLQALRQAQPVLVLEDAATAIAARLTPGGRAGQLIEQLAPTSAAYFALRGRGRTVGLLSLFNGPGRAPLTPDETATAREVAARAGLALDSARLYRQQHDLAEGLQRSLLTDPPEPDHGQIVVRYVAAAEAAQVGGDWYDAFMQPAGATMLVIGDVVGHDTQAAAAMSQVRTIVRTLGALGDDSPAHVLARADRAIANLDLTTTATALAARLEQTLDERARGVTRLRWSSAGHPPAMVVHPDGSVQPLLDLTTDLLLGVQPDTDRRDCEVVLDRGATVLMYTDGLVERRDQPLQEGLQRLQDTLTDLAGDDPSLDELVDQVLQQMLPSRPEDDVAVIAVRLHRQDRPRPAEAGPNRVPAHIPPEPTTPVDSGTVRSPV